MSDAIDQARTQWAGLLPAVDTYPLEVFGRIRRVAELLQSRSDAVLQRHGISRSEFDIISVLGRYARPMTLTEISAETLISAPGTTKRVKKLLAAGLIRRESNPADGRGALVSLTEAATPLLEPVVSSISDLESGVLAPLSDTEQRALVLGLRALLAAFEDED